MRFADQPACALLITPPGQKIPTSSEAGIFRQCESRD
jgi:hypothetical protein